MLPIPPSDALFAVVSVIVRARRPTTAVVIPLIEFGPTPVPWFPRFCRPLHSVGVWASSRGHIFSPKNVWRLSFGFSLGSDRPWLVRPASCRAVRSILSPGTPSLPATSIHRRFGRFRAPEIFGEKCWATYPPILPRLPVDPGGHDALGSQRRSPPKLEFSVWPPSPIHRRFDPFYDQLKSQRNVWRLTSWLNRRPLQS